MTRRELAVDVGVLALCVAIVHVRVLFGGETWAYGDHLSFTLAADEHLGRTLAAGRVPEWWDAIELGTPFAGNPNHGVAYPALWLLALLPRGLGTDVVLLGHLLLGAVGTRTLARRLGADRAGGLLAGILFCASGYATSMIWNGRPLLTLAWTPWLAWAADRVAQADRADVRRVIAGFGLVAGAQILSGDPAGMVTAGLVAVAIVLARAPARGPALVRLTAGYALALAVGAAVLIPGLLFLGTTDRSAGLDPALATAWSLHPRQLLALFSPQALGDAVEPARDLARVLADTSLGKLAGPAWATDHHLGAAAIACAIAGACWSARARRLRGVGVASLVLLVLALGRYTPLYGLYRRLFPPEWILRYPEKHAAGALVLVCALAGVGLAELLAPARRRHALALLGGALAVVLLAVALVHVAIDRRGQAIDVEGARGAARHGALVALAALAIVALAVWRTPARARVIAAASMGAAALIQAAHLVTTVGRDFASSPPSLLAPALASVTPGAPRPRVYRPLGAGMIPAGMSRLERVALDHETAQPNLAARLGLADLPGSSGAYGIGLGTLIGATAPGDAARFLDVTGAAWLLLPAGDPLLAGRTPAASGLGWTLVPNPTARPRAFVTTGPAAVRPCGLARPRPEELTLACDTPGDALAVVLEAAAPGWRATVDGVAVQIEVADGAFLAARVPAGAHTITFQYRTPGLRLGAGISALGLVAAILLRGRRKSLDPLTKHRPPDV